MTPPNSEKRHAATEDDLVLESPAGNDKINSDDATEAHEKNHTAEETNDDQAEATRTPEASEKKKAREEKVTIDIENQGSTLALDKKRTAVEANNNDEVESISRHNANPVGNPGGDGREQHSLQHLHYPPPVNVNTLANNNNTVGTAAAMGYQGGQYHPAYYNYPPAAGWINPAYHNNNTTNMPYNYGWPHPQQPGGPECAAAFAGYHNNPPPPPPSQSPDYRNFLAWQQQSRDPKGGHPKDVEAAFKDDGVEATPAAAVDPAAKRKKKKKNENDAAKSLMLLQTNDDDTPLDTPWSDLVEGSEFVCAQVRGDIPDSLFVAMGQFRACGLTQDDRVGKYKNRELGFVGMCCKHCGGQPGFGRYFPGSYDSFLNGTNCTGAIKHIQSECRACPERVRETVLALEQQEVEGAATTLDTASAHRPRHGSRKRFFSYVWSRLRDIQLPETANDENEIGHPVVVVTTEDHDVSLLDHILAQSDIVSIKDRHLVSDTTLVAMAQMKMCYITEEDRIGRCKDHKVGFKGLCCKHCGGKAGKPGYGRYFPSSLRSLAQADSCQQIIKHVSSKCTSCPADIRSVILEMHRLETSERIRYGSRRIFFRRVWTRLHGEASDVAENPLSDADEPDEVNVSINEDSTNKNDPKKSKEDDDDENFSWDRIIGNSEVVTISDRGLISDAQLAAIAQMSLCKLTEVDRIGWFKNRSIGFGGLCCKHCGGRPSFGRYFPNSVRSFAQTTSSQTIISHVALYCQECPKDIRSTVLRLQRKEHSSEGTMTSNNSMYGSRKIFFDRVWARMHRDDHSNNGATVVGCDSDKADVKPNAVAAAFGESQAAVTAKEGAKKMAPITKRGAVDEVTQAGEVSPNDSPSTRLKSDGRVFQV